MCGQMQTNREGTSLYNRADAIAVWKDLNLMTFIAIRERSSDTSACLGGRGVQSQNADTANALKERVGRL